MSTKTKKFLAKYWIAIVCVAIALFLVAVPVVGAVGYFGIKAVVADRTKAEAAAKQNAAQTKTDEAEALAQQRQNEAAERLYGPNWREVLRTGNNPPR